MELKRKVLAVDDDPRVLHSLTLTLRACGYDVEAVSESHRALERIRAFQPDMVLLDLVMPEVTGMDLCRAIRADAELADLPVIFVSGVSDELDRLAALEIANDYVLKPVEVKELTARVFKAIHVKDLQDELKRQRDELRTMILVDEDTGLFGKRYLIERLGEEMARARRYFYSIACLLVELNDLAVLREQLGEEGGLGLLQEFAMTLRDGLRMADLVCRYGDTCFFILLPSTDSAGARIVADGVVNSLARRSFAAENNLKVSVSIGIAHIGPNELLDRHALLSRAESALESAKRRRDNPIVEG